MFCITRITLVLLSLSLVSTTTFAQVEQNNLVPLLSGSEQQKVKKAEILIGKGKEIESEADKLKSAGSGDKELAKSEKKYNLKRLEASQFYQKGYYDLFNILKENVGEFWKKNKTVGNSLSEIKNKEDKANELFRKAKSLRKVAEDLAYPDEKLVKIIEAENNETEAIETMVKVLYAYLNNPIAYDVLKQQDTKPAAETTKKSDIIELRDTAKMSQKDSILTVKHLPVETKKDSISANKPVRKVPVTSSKDSSIALQQVTVIANKDTTKTPAIKNVNSQSEKVKEKSVSTPVENTKSLKDTSSLYNMITVNEDQIDMFNKFLQTEYPKDYENYIIDFQKLNYSNVDSMKAAWYKYLYANNETQTTVASGSTSKDSVIIATRVTKKEKNANTIAKVSKETNNKENSTKNKVNTPAKEVKQNLEPLEPATGFVYRVQISACRIPLDVASQKSVYNGELTIVELNEDKWYKYAIGEFNTYKKARQLRNKINVPGAFVIAYLNGKRIQILTSMTGHSEYSRMSTPESSNVADLVFKVQISASKRPLNKNYLQNIYSGSKVVEEISEDGWYKYVITMGNSFKEAKKFIETENIPGAFISAEFKGQKTELNEALKLLRKSK